MCIFNFRFNIIYLLALFLVAIRRDSVSLKWFPFHNHVCVFLCEISPVCCILGRTCNSHFVLFFFVCFFFVGFCVWGGVFRLFFFSVFGIIFTFLEEVIHFIFVHPFYSQVSSKDSIFIKVHEAVCNKRLVNTKVSGVNFVSMKSFQYWRLGWIASLGIQG